MLSTATDGAGTFYVDFQLPDRERLDGRGVSRDYEIEYQYADRPNLALGDLMTIGGVSYRVRQPPYIRDEGNASSGYFRRAILTKV